MYNSSPKGSISCGIVYEDTAGVQVKILPAPPKNKKEKKMNKIFCVEPGPCGYKSLFTASSPSSVVYASVTCLVCNFVGQCEFQRPRNNSVYLNPEPRPSDDIKRKLEGK